MRIVVSFFIAAAAALAAAAETDPVRRIEERFLAPCCWRESVAVHQSPKAEELRTEIRRLVGENKSEADIVEHMVAQYGERILRVPRGRPSFWLLVIPLVVLGGGGLALAVYLRRAYRAPPEQPPPGAESVILPDWDDDALDTPAPARPAAGQGMWNRNSE